DSGSPRSISPIITPMRSITASTASTRRLSARRCPARTSASASSAAWLRASSWGKSKKPQLPFTVWTKRKIVSSRARSSGLASQATISPASAPSISRVSATNSASRSSMAPAPRTSGRAAMRQVWLRAGYVSTASAARDLRLLLGDEFDQRRLPGFGRGDCPAQRGDYLGRLGHALAVAAERAGERGVVARDIGGAVLRGRLGHDRQLDRHRLVVEQDRQDRDALACGGLEIGAGEADRRVAPDVDAKLVGTGELGAHRQAEAVAKLGRLAPADVAVRAAALPERHQLVARAAGVVGDDRVGDVDGLLQVPKYAVRGQRARLLRALGLP